MKITKTTPILCVKSIEESLPFWTGMLGYTKTVEVPHEGRLGFVILVKGDTEIMLQTRESILADAPQVAQHFPVGSMSLYSDVDSIEEAQKALQGAQVLVPLRKTFYGAREIFVLSPEGYVLGFAQHEA